MNSLCLCIPAANHHIEMACRAKLYDSFRLDLLGSLERCPQPARLHHPRNRCVPPPSREQLLSALCGGEAMAVV